MHNYIDGANNPGVTLQSTLMNHTRTVQSVQQHVVFKRDLTSLGIEVPYILGETNSLYNQGTSGLSDSFGAALWGVDFNLYCASVGIERVHMHQGTDYRYAAWQPVDTDKTTKGTKAPYYGSIAVASMLGNLERGKIQILNLPLRRSSEAAYAVYDDEKLVRILVINMMSYNYSVPHPGPRPSEAYSIDLPSSCRRAGSVQYLMANGSDAITGITFGGASYNYELNEGKPVLVNNITRIEKIYARRSQLNVALPHSSAAMVSLDC